MDQFKKFEHAYAMGGRCSGEYCGKVGDNLQFDVSMLPFQLGLYSATGQNVITLLGTFRETSFVLVPTAAWERIN